MKTSGTLDSGPPRILLCVDKYGRNAEKLLKLITKHHGYDYNSMDIVDPTDNNMEQVLDQLQPHVIVAMGKTSSDEIMGGSTALTKARVGPPKPHPQRPDIRVICTYHPAMALRQGSVFPDLIADFAKIKGPEGVTWKEPPWALCNTYHRAESAIGRLTHSPYLVLDIEVGVATENYSHPDLLLCIGLQGEGLPAYVFNQDMCESDYIGPMLAELIDNHKGIVCHNGKFDLQVLERLGFCKGPKLHYDTMLASYTFDERQGVHGLKHISAELLGAPAYDLEIKQYISGGQSFANIPKELLHKYNAYDVALTTELYLHYMGLMEEDPNSRELHDRLVTYSDTLNRLEMDGVQVDIDYMEQLDSEMLTSLGNLEEELSEWVDNPRSPKQVKDALWSLCRRVDSTNVETLNNLLEEFWETKPEAVRFIELMLQYRKEQKLHGTYVKGIQKRLIGDRVYPSFLLHGTVSGRLACRNPNLQNVPRDPKIRKLFIPKEGNLFVQADYGQAELRVITCLAEDKYLQGVFAEDRDLHSEIAERFFGPGFTKDQRVRAKAVVFGLAYGREAFSLAQEFKIPVEEAQRYVDTFFEVIPDVVRWRKGLEKSVLLDNEVLETPYHRKRRFWLITAENQREVLNETYSFLPQSIASDLTLASLTHMLEQMQGIYKPRITVHDSIMMEAPEAAASMCGHIMKSIMQKTAEGFSDFVPWPVDIEIGPSWGELEEVDA